MLFWFNQSWFYDLNEQVQYSKRTMEEITNLCFDFFAHIPKSTLVMQGTELRRTRDMGKQERMSSCRFTPEKRNLEETRKKRRRLRHKHQV